MEQNKGSDKSILLINDMPGYGKVALGAMIPILSKMGFQVFNLPTAVVSNTLDYGKFEILDTTDYMKNTIEVWKDLGFAFDCICTGFIVSAEQVEIIGNYIASCRDRLETVIVDPIMGDDGKLYNGVSEDTVENMRRLVSYADVTIPNVTEAAFLTGLYEGREILKKQERTEIIDGLRELGSRSVVITSLTCEESGEHLVSGYSHYEDEYFEIPFDFVPVRFAGTGDLFSSVMAGNLFRGKDLKDSVTKAMNLVHKLILENKDNVDKYKGIPLEKHLYDIV